MWFKRLSWEIHPKYKAKDKVLGFKREIVGLMEDRAKRTHINTKRCLKEKECSGWERIIVNCSIDKVGSVDFSYIKKNWSYLHS